MSAHEGRIGPLQHEHPGCRGPRTSADIGDGLLQALQPQPQLRDQRPTAVRNPGGIGDGLHRVDDLVQGLRIDLQDLGPATQLGDGVIHVAAGDRADPAEILAEDEVRITGRQGVLVEGVEVLAGRHPRTNQFVDLVRIQVRGVHAAHHDGPTLPSVGWKVALEGHAQQLLRQTELEDDLGGRGKQADDAHETRVMICHDGPMSGWEQLRDGVDLPFHPDITVPDLIEVRLAVESPRTVADVEGAVRRSVIAEFGSAVQPGMTVAVGAGSRGLTQRVEMLRGAVSGLRELGAEPFVVPAMGSHGGGTAEGQRDMLGTLGITQDSVGAEIRSSMDTVQVAATHDGMPLYLDRHAAAADRILPVNRVKPHTCFKGPIESGCTKMAVVGFGKQPGAAQIHSCGPVEMRDRLLSGIAALRATGRLLGGVASVESAEGSIVTVEALSADDVGGRREEELTAQARALVPTLPFEEIDVLIIERGGKDISGTSMDPNVIGRFWVHGLEDFASPQVATVVLLGITEISAGNVLGIGLADFIPVSVAERIDWQKTYLNCFTAGPAGVRRSRMPMVLKDEEACVRAALSMCGRGLHEPKRVVRIESTLHLTRCWVSENLLGSLPAGATISRIA